jgi:hypothetical protein
MVTLLKPMKLNADTARVLEGIRKGAENALYGAAPAAANGAVSQARRIAR